jgi:hypothetical protein
LTPSISRILARAVISPGVVPRLGEPALELLNLDGVFDLRRPCENANRIQPVRIAEIL